MNDTSIYKITRSDNLSYIGITKNLKTRISQHRKSKRFSEGIKTVEILEENLNYDEAEKKEEYYIDLYDTYKSGLNATPHGKGKNQNCKFNTLGFKFSDESRKKMSESAKRRGTPWLKGYKHSEKLKSHWSQIRKGKYWGSRKISLKISEEIINVFEGDILDEIPSSFIAEQTIQSQVSAVLKNELELSEIISKNGRPLSKKAIVSRWYAKKLGTTHQAIRRIITIYENKHKI